MVAMKIICLTLVDEDMALSLTMMADAGEDNLELVRFLDREKLGTIGISHECQRFLEPITVLFEWQGCFWVRTHCAHVASLGEGEAASHGPQTHMGRRHLFKPVN